MLTKLLRCNRAASMLDKAVYAVCCPLQACKECPVFKLKNLLGCFDPHQLEFYLIEGLLCICWQCLYEELNLRRV